MAVLTSAATAPDASADERPAWDVASAAALTWVTVGAALLLLGGLVHTVAAVQQVAPDWLTTNAVTSFGRLRPAAASLVVYGGLGFLGTGVALEVVRRLVRVPLQLEIVARAGGALATLGLGIGTVAILLGRGTGRPGLELPWYAAVPLALGLLLATVSAMRTLACREEDAIHPALWHLAAALVAGPVLLLLGSLSRPAGVNDELVRVFAVTGLHLLWLVQLGMGIALYVVPVVCRTPLYSRSLAGAGFWGWVAFAPFVGPVHLLSGPAPDWTETVGAAASVALVVPALAFAVNVLSTYGRRTTHAPSPELRLARAGAGLLLVLAALLPVAASRTAGDLLHLTVAPDGLAELVLLGIAGTLVAAGAYHVLPRLTGNRLANPRLAATSGWLLAGGALLVLLALLTAGYVQGALWTEGIRSGTTPYTGAGWLTVTDVLRPLLWLRVLGEALVAAAWVVLFQQVLSTTAYSDPLES